MRWVKNLKYLAYMGQLGELYMGIMTVVRMFKQGASDQAKREAVLALARDVLNLIMRAVPQTKGLDKYLDVTIEGNQIGISLDVKEVAETF